ncbi:Adducin-related protein [Diplonema papillatum]|nr:Adducin-related protein [Diplonema papillatum]
MSSEEALLRKQLRVAYKMCHKEGLNEGVDNHLSVAVDGTEALLTLPHGVMWADVEEEDFALVDYDGNILKQGKHNKRPDISAVCIHGMVHKLLGKRAKAVFHTHQYYATLLACHSEYKVKQVHQNSCRYLKNVVYYREFNGIVDNKQEGSRIARAFLENPEAIVQQMLHHGVTVIGRTVAEAMEDTYFFEKACKMQVGLHQMAPHRPLLEMHEKSALKVYEYQLKDKTRTSTNLYDAWEEHIIKAKL